MNLVALEVALGVQVSKSAFEKSVIIEIEKCMYSLCCALDNQQKPSDFAGSYRQKLLKKKI